MFFCGYLLFAAHDQTAQSASNSCPVADSWARINLNRYRASLLQTSAARCRERGDDCPGVQIDWENARVVSVEAAEAYAEKLNTDAESAEQSLPNPSTVDIVTWDSGDQGKQWTPAEMDLVKNTLNALKDRELRNWIAKNVHFERDPNDVVSPNLPRGSPISMAGSKLRIKDDFFSRIKQTRRENLLVFEAGKVFENSMIDHNLEYTPATSGFLIDAMEAANHNGQNLSDLNERDKWAVLAYIFRAQALRLPIPQKDKDLRKKWESVTCEFEERARPLF